MVTLGWEPDTLSADEKAQWREIVEGVAAPLPGSGDLRFALEGQEWVLASASWGIAYPDGFVYRHNQEMEPVRSRMIQALVTRGKQVRLPKDGQG
jgi:hypothetical protein